MVSMCKNMEVEEKHVQEKHHALVKDLRILLGKETWNNPMLTKSIMSCRQWKGFQGQETARGSQQMVNGGSDKGTRP